MGNHWHYFTWADLTATLALCQVPWGIRQVKSQPYGVLLRIINARMEAAGDGSS